MNSEYGSTQGTLSTRTRTLRHARTGVDVPTVEARNAGADRRGHDGEAVLVRRAPERRVPRRQLPAAVDHARERRRGAHATRHVCAGTGHICAGTARRHVGAPADLAEPQLALHMPHVDGHKPPEKVCAGVGCGARQVAERAAQGSMRSSPAQRCGTMQRRTPASPCCSTACRNRAQDAAAVAAHLGVSPCASHQRPV